jgi:hypothetical protein
VNDLVHPGKDGPRSLIRSFVPLTGQSLLHQKEERSD